MFLQRQTVRSVFVLLTIVLLTRQVQAQSEPTHSGEIPTGTVAVVRGEGAQLLDEQGQPTSVHLTAGMLVMLLARNGEDNLLYIDSGPDGTGWVAASSLLTVSTSALPLRALTQTAATPAAVANGTTLSTPLGISGTTAVSPTTVITEAASIVDVAALSPENEAVATPQPITAAIVGQVALTASRLNLRAGPGTAYAIVAKAEPGSTWPITGRTAASDWVQVRDDEMNETLWAADDYIELTAGKLADAPVITDIPSAPTPTATPILAPTALPPAATGASPVGSGRRGATGLAGKLVFQDRIGGTIYVYDLGTDTLRALTSGVDPAISTAGTQVAFARDGGDGGLHVINIDGSGERLLYNKETIVRSPKWSPDDQLIVFSRSNGFEDCRLLDGGVCLPDDAIWDTLPAPLQTGQARNALRGIPNQRAYFFVLSRIGLDGENYRDIPSLNRAQAPDWNAAGITYYSGSAGIQITTDTADARSAEVVNDALLGYFQDPDWQPGGGRIVFHRQMGGQHWQIFIVNPDGSGLAALTAPVTALVDELPSSVSPAWSPDGQHIVYVSNRNSIEAAGAWHIWVMNADGSDQRMLPVDVPLNYTFSAEQMVSWGP